MSTAVSALRQSWLSDDGLILHVLPCSFTGSRFAGPLPSCAMRSARAVNTSSSFLRWDLPIAIYSGGRLGANVARDGQLWLEPHAWESENTDVGYGTAIGFILGGGARRGVAFASDAWAEVVPTPRVVRRPCAPRSPQEYAQTRLDFFHGTEAHRNRRAAWKKYVLGGPPARQPCFYDDWEAALGEQRAYAEALAAAQPSTDYSVGAEAEHGSGFSFLYNQVQVSWTPQDVRAVFYVNDSLTPALLLPGAADAAWRRRTRRLANQTKLLPRALREGARMPRLRALADRLVTLSRSRARAAYDRARTVARALELECQCDDPAPPVVQLRLSAENFDAEPAAQRARMGARAAKTPVCKGTARTRGCVSAADFIAAPERR